METSTHLIKADLSGWDNCTLKGTLHASGDAVLGTGTIRWKQLAGVYGYLPNMTHHKAYLRVDVSLVGIPSGNAVQYVTVGWPVQNASCIRISISLYVHISDITTCYSFQSL